LVLGDSSDELEDKNPSLKSLPLSIPLLYFSHGCKNANVSKSLDTCFLNLQPPHATALINLVALGRFSFFFSSFRYLHAEEIVRFTHVAVFVSCPFVDGASFCEGFSDTFV
jgi:hypothetical protein